MWSLLVPLAAATPAADTSCAPGTVQGFRPADGSTVPPEVVVQVAFEGCAIALQLETGLAEPVASEQQFSGGQVDIVPVEPLDPGVYALVDYTQGTRDVLGTFTVAEGADVPPWSPPELAMTAERSCEGALTTWVDVVATFTPDPDGWAVLVLEVSTENGVQQSVDRLWYGQPRIDAGVGVFGGREACVTARLLDAIGTEVWTGEPVCAEPFEGCPADPRAPSAEEEGCGCASGGAAGWLALGPALLALRGRAVTDVRRRRAR